MILNLVPTCAFEPWMANIITCRRVLALSISLGTLCLITSLNYPMIKLLEYSNKNNDRIFSLKSFS